MKHTLFWLVVLALAGCATHPKKMKDIEPSVSAQAQRAAQEAQFAQAPLKLGLKRKIAVGRISNETTYGKSLLRSGADELGNKVTDMFLQALANSGNYLVFERPDVALLAAEQALTGQTMNLVGVDTLVIGSLTEFGRATTGESGFFSSSKKQEATAKVDLRLVDTGTGQVFKSVSGSGSSSTETASTLGFGSVASYDGSINDQAIGAAVNAVVEKLTLMMLQKPWSADILAYEDGLLHFSGGKSQGVREGMTFHLVAQGKTVRSQTTGADIQLPGKVIGTLRVESLFGDSELREGAAGILIEGSVAGYPLAQIHVEEIKP